jgi:hypothetical protein
VDVDIDSRWRRRVGDNAPYLLLAPIRGSICLRMLGVARGRDALVAWRGLFPPSRNRSRSAGSGLRRALHEPP